LPAPRLQPVGILGGTFDPVHFGHLRLAEELGDLLGMEEVRLIPSSLPPHRADPGVSAADRYEMVRLAVAGNNRLMADDRELHRLGPSYTVDTLTELRQELGTERPLCLMLGADAFAALLTWSHWQRLFELAHVVVATRPGYALDFDDLPEPLSTEARARFATALGATPAGSVITREIAALDISASAIRRGVAAAQSVRYLLPDSVLDYIQAHRLYRGTHGG